MWTAGSDDNILLVCHYLFSLIHSTKYCLVKLSVLCMQLSDFLSSCEPPWCWTNTCHWRLCPGRGQEWSRAWCVGCPGGATTVSVEARPPSPWGRSQCPLSPLQGVTAASPLMETSQQTWSVLATGLEEKMHARYRGQTPSLTIVLKSFSCEVSGCCTLMARPIGQSWQTRSFDLFKSH